MSDERLSRVNAILKEPLRQRILLEFGKHKNLTINELTKNLKIYNNQELISQLNFLEQITFDEAHLLSKQLSSGSDEYYTLTDKGHDVLMALILMPELKSENFASQTITKPKWFTPYWIVIFVSTIIVVGIIIPYFGHIPLDKTVFYLTMSLLALGFGYYIRVKPSTTLNRLIYIGLLGFVIGCAFWFVSLFIALISVSNRTESTDNVIFIVITSLSFTLGPLVGYIIGKARHFKGPEQYSP
jgi:hypothetical protein